MEAQSKADALIGRLVKDKITGFSGRVTGYVQYITGCNQALVAPPIDKDGKGVSAAWFDEQRLEFVDGSRLTLDNSKSPGCGEPAPIR